MNTRYQFARRYSSYYLLIYSSQQTLLTGGIADPGQRSNSRKGKEREITVDNNTGGSLPSATDGVCYVFSLKPVDWNSALVVEPPKKTLSQHKVRTSLQERTLDSMFPVVNPARVDGSSTDNRVNGSQNAIKSRDVPESECNLTSVRNLRQGVVKGRHKREGSSLGVPGRFKSMALSDLTEILENHTFVGVVDLDRCLSLIQHSTKLYLVNHAALA